MVWKVRHDEVEAKLAALQGDFERAKLAAEAALARRGRAEEEVKDMRRKVRALVDKTAADDELIQALQDERASRKTRKAGCGHLACTICTTPISQRCGDVRRDERLWDFDLGWSRRMRMPGYVD